MDNLAGIQGSTDRSASALQVLHVLGISRALQKYVCGIKRAIVKSNFVEPLLLGDIALWLLPIRGGWGS